MPSPGLNNVEVRAIDGSGRITTVKRTITYKTDGPVIKEVEFEKIVKCGQMVEFTVTLAD